MTVAAIETPAHVPESTAAESRISPPAESTPTLPRIRVLPECFQKLDGYPALQELLLRSSPDDLSRIFDEISTPFGDRVLRPLTILDSADRSALLAWAGGTSLEESSPSSR